VETLQDFEKDKYQAKAAGISIVLYSFILISLYLIKIAYEPVAEPIAMGVDLNYGVDLVGSGDIQTTNKANSSKNNYDVKPEENKVISKPKPTKVVEPKPVKPPEKAISAPSKILTAEEDSKVTVKKPSETTKPSTKPSLDNSTKTTSKPAVNPTPPQPQRIVDNGSLFKKPTSGTSGSNGTTGTKSGLGGNNNGDGKPGEVGDKGDPRGTLDGKSLYGNPGKGGGSSGASVSISGWKNKGPLNIPKDNSSETGRIRFKVVIDETGEVIAISVLESSLSPSITNYYKDQIKRKLKANLIPEGNPNGNSNGTITINITRGA
jgi:outer membrane biosynthesis protein TonB